MLACSSPRLFAACHVLHRRLVPRHPSCALSCLTDAPCPNSQPKPRAVARGRDYTPFSHQSHQKAVTYFFPRLLWLRLPRIRTKTLLRRAKASPKALTSLYLYCQKAGVSFRANPRPTVASGLNQSCGPPADAAQQEKIDKTGASVNRLRDRRRQSSTGRRNPKLSLHPACGEELLHLIGCNEEIT
jgi:hypothetical protein